MKSKKLILGTANLASSYGLNNSNITKNSSLKKIFLILKKQKIFFIDTAYSYKNAQKYLSKFDLKKFKIISKLPFIPKKIDIDKIESHIVNFVHKTLKQLKINYFYALLVHNTEELEGEKGKKIFATLNFLKKQGLVKKIGYSIYSPKELDIYIKRFKPDLIQGPLNLFDQRMFTSGWMKRLNNSGIKFYARSIFLQGLLLKNFNKVPLKFKKYNTIFEKYHSWLKINNIDSFKACLSFIYSLKFIDKIIVGIDNVNQFNKIINFKLSKKKLNFKLLNCTKNNLIDPRTW